MTDPLTIQMMAECNWQTIIESAGDQDCMEFHRLMLHKTAAAEKEGNRCAPVFALIRDISGMHLNLDNPRQPYSFDTFNGFRGFSLDDLQSEEVAILEQLADDVRNPELRARICDICWTLNRKKYEFGISAARSYLASALRLANSETPPSVACTKVSRAMQIAAMLRNREVYEDIVQQLEDAAAREDIHPMVAETALKELVEQRAGDARRQRTIAQTRATQCREVDPYRERGFWSLAETLSLRLKDDDGVIKARNATAESHFHQAEVLAALPDRTAGAAVAHHLEHGLHVLKSVPESHERRDEVHRRLLETQFAQSQQMGRVTANTDIADAVRATKEYVRDAEPQEALFRLALVSRSPSVDDLRKEVLAAAKDFPLQHMFPRVIVAADGRPIARRAGLLSDDSTAHEQAVESEMARHAGMHHAVTVNAAIIPAMEQIEIDHVIQSGHFEQIVMGSPFVPPGHITAFTTGLYDGFNMKLIESCHVLAPQVEASIRHLLKTKGVITSKLSPEGIQEERNLNDLLATEEAKAVFGPDILFDLRCLLVERFGSNLRNDVAHGLLDDAAFFSVPVIYFWWLTLRLVCLPLLPQREAPEKSEAP